MKLTKLILLAGLLCLLAIVSLSYNARAEELEWTASINDYVTSVALSGDGQYMVLGSYEDVDGIDYDGSVYLYNQTGDRLWRHKVEEPVNSVAISSNGNNIAAGSNDGYVYFFSNNQSEPIWRYDTGTNWLTLAMSADGEYIVVGCWNGDVLLLARNGTKLWSYTTGDQVQTVDISDDGALITAGGYEDIVYLFAHNGTKLWEYYAGNNIADVSISGNEAFITAAAGDKILFFSQDGDKLWEYLTGSPVQSIAVSADGDYIAAASRDENIYLFDNDGNKIWNYDTDEDMDHVSISDDGKYITSGGCGYTFAFDRDSSTPIWNKAYPNRCSWPQTVVSGDGSYIAHGVESSGHYYWNGEFTSVIDTISPAPGSQGIDISFSGHGVDGLPIKGYQWNSSLDGFLSNKATFGIDNLSTGKHTISFRVRDWNGNWSDWDVREVEVHAAPVAHIDSITPTRPNEGQIINFMGHGSSSLLIIGYEWVSDIDNVFSTNNSFSISDLSTGDHVISFRVMDENGAWSEPVQQLLNYNANPVATIVKILPEKPKAGEEASFTGLGVDSDGTVENYEWDLYGNGRLVYHYTSPTAEFTYPIDGNFTVRFRVEDDNGAWSDWVETTLEIGPVDGCPSDECDDSPAPGLLLVFMAVAMALAFVAVHRRA